MKKQYRTFVIVVLVFLIIINCISPKETEADVKQNKKSISISVGEKYKLKLQGANGTVKWKSSDRSIATVSKKGTVKGKKSGKTTVIATYKKRSYKFNIKVVNKGSDADTAVAKIRENAEKRKNNIVNSKYVVSSSGQTYFISPDGNDTNDGTTPETAWATLDRAFNTLHEECDPEGHDEKGIVSGDAVLIERGSTYTVNADVFYGLNSDSYVIPEGVVLGAYGEGAKPVITGSLSEADDENFWTLWYDKKGVKIWTSAQKVQDTNVIVFDDGKEWAEEIIPCWSTKLNTFCNHAGDEWNVVSELNRDLSFCYMPEYAGIKATEVTNNDYTTGIIYLRCDKGNPADVYEKIELPHAQTGFTLRTGASICGLNIRCFTCNAILMDCYCGDTCMTTCNCEISFCGGLFAGYQEYYKYDDVLIPHCGGAAIQVSSPGNRVKDCYIHDSGPMALTMSIHFADEGLYVYDDIKHTGNLIERSGTAFHIADLAYMDKPDVIGYISNYEFSDNMVMDTASGWVGNLVRQLLNSDVDFRSCVTNCMGPSDGENIIISDNVFCGSDYSLIIIDDTTATGRNVGIPLTFSGNTYVQDKGKYLGVFLWKEFLVSGEKDRYNEFLQFLGDTKGMIYECDREGTK